MTYRETLNIIGTNVVINARNNLLKRNAKGYKTYASGELWRSIEYEINTNDELEFNMLSYGKYVESGRKKYRKNKSFKKYKSTGGKTFIEALKKWCRIKGFDESAAYAIRFVINRDGIPKKPFLSDAVDKVYDNMEKYIDEYVDELVDGYMLDILSKDFN